MHDFRNKVAVITGAASGIGLGLARTFASEGMTVALLDLRSETLADAARQVQEFGGNVLAIQADVSDCDELERIAQSIEHAFGNIHIVCNNAGVVVHDKTVLETTYQDWDWIVDTNLHGEINVVKTFLPRMLAHGENGHLINTASIGGFQVRLGKKTGSYAVTKYGIVALTEALAHDLAETAIGVSVLAPAAVNTNLYNSSAVLEPNALGEPAGDRMPEHFRNAMPPDMVGRRVLAAIRNGDVYIFTHLATREWLLERHATIVAAYDATEAWAREDGALEMSSRP